MTNLTETIPTTETTIPAITAVIIESVVETYAAICENTPQVAAAGQEMTKNNLCIGIISLVGRAPILLSLAFPEDTAVNVSEKFLGNRVAFDSLDMSDLVGELCNVIAGDTKARLEGVGVAAELSLPSVVRGDSLELLFGDQVDSAEETMTSDEGLFKIRIAIANELGEFGP